MKNTLKVVAVLSSSLFFVGCQSTSEQKAEEIVQTNQQTDYLSEAKVSLDALQLEIKQARKDNLSYFSPDVYERAIEAYQEAFSHYTDIVTNGHSSLSFTSKTEQYEEAKLTILTYISQSKQNLQLAYGIRKTAETTLAESFALKQRLDELNVPTLYARDYKRVSQEIDELVELVAEGEVVEAQKDQPKLLSKMTALEVRAVKQIELGDIDQQISQLKKSRKDDYVPISFERLIEARNKADATISVNPRDDENIKITVDAAKYELAHVEQIYQEVIKLKNLKRKDYESYLLNYEANLAKIAVSVGLGGIKNLTFAKQVGAISEQGSTLEKSLAATEADLANLQGSSDQANTALAQQREHFTAQIQALENKNKSLEESQAQLQATYNVNEIELIKLKAYKEAIESVNQAKVVAPEKPSVKQVAKPEPATKAKLPENPEAPIKEPLVTEPATELAPATSIKESIDTMSVEAAQDEILADEALIEAEVVSTTQAEAIEVMEDAEEVMVEASTEKAAGATQE